MAQGDFLKPLFDLSPFLVAFLIWLWGFGSLVFYGIKTKAIRSVILKTPGIIIGDFFIIPTLGFLITYFYQAIENPLVVTSSSCWSAVTCLIAIILATISAIRFDLVNRWFFPHTVFYWFMAYILLTFLTKGLYQVIFGELALKLRIIWLFVLIGTLTHITMGVVWSKKFPRLE